MSETTTTAAVAPGQGRVDRTQPRVIRAQGIWKVFGPRGERLVARPTQRQPFEQFKTL